MKSTHPRVLSLFFLLFFLLPGAFAQGEAEGKNGMVATAHPLASEAAIAMLQEGGNAVDAAVAAAFAIGVVEPDGSGLGGGGGMVIYMKETNQSHYINYYARASERGSEAGYSGSRDAKTAKAICVPGTVAGLIMAHEEFGSLPLQTIMEPAIRYASEGFTIDATLATLILDNIETVFADRVTTDIFCDDGFPLMEGDRIVQKELAETLAVISREGKKGFYEGAVAESMVEGISKRGGTLTLNDFRAYKAELTIPLHGTYRGYDILTANVPQSGLCLIEALNILERYDLKNAPHYSESAKTLHLIAEAERFTYADRTAYLGDPDDNEIPVSGLISKRYAKKRYRQINQKQLDPPVYRDVEEGDPTPYVKRERHKDKPETADAGGHTTHLSVIDKEGNSVALTQTLGLFFGSGQTVEGVLMNCAMTNFSHRSKNSVNFYKDGKQSRSSIMPTIILKDDNPFLIAGSPGAARIITTLIEVIINVIDYEMSVTEANLAPRFFVRDSEDYLYLESGIKPEVRDELTEMGHTLNVYQGIDLFFGGAQLIYIDPENGSYFGSADKRRGGIAIGY
ncbi:MAG: gamma-glutamyltransferase [Bacteroidota bacterium]